MNPYEGFDASEKIKFLHIYFGMTYYSTFIYIITLLHNVATTVAFITRMMLSVGINIVHN